MPSDIYNWDDQRGNSGNYYSSRRDFAMMPRSPQEALEPDHAPDVPPGRKRRRQHPVLAFLNVMLTLSFVGVIALTAAFFIVRALFDRPGPLTHATVVAIPRGEGLSAISERLEREGIIIDRRIFAASAVYFSASDKLKAGEYAIERGASIRQVLDTLVEGKAILFQVSLPEGLTSAQIVERLRNTPDLTGEITAMPAEGSLLPDTYRFARGTSRDDMVRRMQSEQAKFIDTIWDGRQSGLPFKTKAEAVTLASIVEKETGRADERQRVAAVFVNRLAKRMRLQSDPTIIYGLSGGKGALGRGITKAEIEQTTPYNTYRINGLPPTAIANPGRASLDAVLRPGQTTELYFVADGTGGHAFASTLAEHNANVAKWRAIEVEARLKAEEAAKAAAAALPGSADATLLNVGPSPVPVLPPGTRLKPAAAPAAGAVAPVADKPKPKRPTPPQPQTGQAVPSAQGTPPSATR